MEDEAHCYNYAVMCCCGSGLCCRCINPCTACYACGFRNVLRKEYELPVRARPACPCLKPDAVATALQADCCCLPWCETGGCGYLGDYFTLCLCGKCAECQMTFEIYARKKLPYAQKQPLLQSEQPAAGQMGAGSGSGTSEPAAPGVVSGCNDGEIPVEHLSNAVEQSVQGGGWQAQKEEREKGKKGGEKSLCCAGCRLPLFV